MENSLIAVFLTVLGTNFAAEFGDKTQLLLVGMTSKYKMRDIISGTVAAVFVLNGIAVFTGGVLNEILKQWLWAVKFAAAAAFVYFAVTSLIAEDEEEEEARESKITFAPLAVCCTFIIAELGDKTQLTALTFGANYGMSLAFLIWTACTIGLLAADLIGVLLGQIIQKYISKRKMNLISFVLFACFGIITLIQGILLLRQKFGE